MHISFYLLVPLISLSIMLVTPNLNFHSNAIAMVDGYAEGNGLYNNYENAASPPPEGNGLYNNYENAASPPERNGLYNNYENAASPPPAEGNGLYNNYENAGLTTTRRKWSL